MKRRGMQITGWTIFLIIAVIFVAALFWILWPTIGGLPDAIARWAS